MKALSLALLLALAASPLAAHEAHETVHAVKETVAKAGETVQKAGQTVQQVGKDAKALAEDAKDAVEGAVDKVQRAAQAEPMDVLKDSVNSHWHNKLVHFPVALGIFGVLFFIASLRWPAYLWPSRSPLAGVVLFGLAALRSGEAAEEGFHGSSLMETVHAHENAAKAAMVLLLLQLLLTWFPSFKKWSWVVGLLACAAIILAGAFGGALAAS